MTLRRQITYVVLTKVEYVVTMFSISILYILPQIIHFFLADFECAMPINCKKKIFVFLESFVLCDSLFLKTTKTLQELCAGFSSNRNKMSDQ